MGRPGGQALALNTLLQLLFETWLPWLVVGVFLVGGLWVLAARPRALLNRAMGAFLLLYAGSTAAYQRWIGTPSIDGIERFHALEALVWFELPFPFLTALVLISLFAPEQRSRKQRMGVVAMVACIAGLLGLYLIFPHALFHDPPAPGAPFVGERSRGPVTLLHGFLWLVVQATVVFVAARAARSTKRPALQRRQAALVGLAYVFPLGAQAVEMSWRTATGLAFGYPTPFSRGLALDVYGVLGLATLPLVLWAWAQYPRPFRLRARRVVRWLVLLAALLPLLEVLGTERALPGVRIRSFRPVWLGALAITHVVAAVKYDVAGSGHAHRQRTGRTVVALAALAVPGALLGLEAGRTGLDPYGLAALGTASVLVAALVAPWLRGRLAASSGRPLSRPGPDHALSTGVATYRDALADLQDAAGRLPAGHGPGLAALRAELGLSARDHDVLVASLSEDGTVGTAPRVVLGRYLVEEELGRGGSATVYKARDPVHGRTVVLKRYHVDGSARRSFLAELETLSRFRGRRVISLYDAEEVDDELVLVLEHAEGRSLADLLEDRGPLDLRTAVGLTCQVLEALETVHAAGYVHGDVKPANVLLDQAGDVKLGDFGTARLSARDPEVTRSLGAGPGTLTVMAPEQVAGGTARPASDTYAAGALLYRLVTGEHYVTFEDGNPLVYRDRILNDPPRLAHPGIPRELEPVLARALAKDPEERFPSAGAMHDALASIPSGPENAPGGAREGRRFDDPEPA